MINHTTHKVNPYLVLAALFTGLNGALRINMSVRASASTLMYYTDM
jgi:hypothetical protein